MRYWLRTFLDELFLASGQYTLFYIILGFSAEKLAFFSNTATMALFVLLIVQTVLLMRFGNRFASRIFLSFICPLSFSIIQVTSGGFSLLNMNLLFYWLTTVSFSILKSICKRTKRPTLKKTIEFFISMGTVFVFLFLSFYYDLMLSFGVKSAAGLLEGVQASKFFDVANFPWAFLEFIQASERRFIIFSSLLIGLILATARIRILSLKYRITYLFEKDADAQAANVNRTPQRKDARTVDAVILYSDIRNFSVISEKSNPNSVADMLNLYFSTWEVTARKFGGQLDKYNGDAVSFVFGMEGDVDAADKAIECAFDFLAQLPTFQEEFAIRNLPVVKDVGIGISAGEIIVGDIGHQDRVLPVIIGYPINSAARLESLCREYRQDFIIDQTVYKKITIENQSRFIALGDILLKGKNQPITVYGRK